MLRNSFCILLILFADSFCHPTVEVPWENGSTFDDDTPQGSTREAQRAENLAKLQQILGISGPTHGPRLHVTRPQFMSELYNIVADSDGVNLREYPHKAKIVRSFNEKDSSLSYYYAFNFTGLETNESLLAAELHLHLKKTLLATIHPAAGLLAPYYVIRVYQVLDAHQLDIPDSHVLLTAHRVAADASGWQVLDVKQAVLSWMSGTPNLGFLVTVSNSLGSSAAVHFSRRTENDDKQPILVLFTDYGVETRNSGLEGVGIERQKREATSPRNGDSARVVTSMEVYEWATSKAELIRTGNIANAESQNSEAVRQHRRSRSTKKVSTIADPTPHYSGCARHELYVDFQTIGWNEWIVAPLGYDAYQCKGHCSMPGITNLTSTNHAQVQSLLHALTGADNVDEPCCVPVKLGSISVLYLIESDVVVLRNFRDMVVRGCGCH